jgi:hypothetical protein
MFFGIVLLCIQGATEISGETCVLYNSPNSYDTEDMCIKAIGNVLMSEAMELNVAAGLELRNAKCFDVRPGQMANSM